MTIRVAQAKELLKLTKVQEERALARAKRSRAEFEAARDRHAEVTRESWPVDAQNASQQELAARRQWHAARLARLEAAARSAAQAAAAVEASKGPARKATGRRLAVEQLLREAAARERRQTS